MNRNLIILTLALLPVFTHAQSSEKCKDVVDIPKTLSDSFQNTKSNLEAAEARIATSKEARVEIMKKYLGCEKQQM